ncbi:hypothetical protein CCMSSC00406_0005872 [Pleurotus cornucopiae]|uniref:Uncharacterized protein n=1 Tax=Pleurotus cornucopiae TaxID=5321 RepID=A0ACB7JB01_PLECO|nr:hypothetical protein CCMSSC00406_0005872 [Pleurotus cornucopiae]
MPVPELMSQLTGQQIHGAMLIDAVPISNFQLQTPSKRIHSPRINIRILSTVIAVHSEYNYTSTRCCGKPLRDEPLQKGGRGRLQQQDTSEKPEARLVLKLKLKVRDPAQMHRVSV